MNGFVDFLRFRLIHGENLDQILDRCVPQSFEIREAGFHQQQGLFIRNRQRATQGLRRLRDLLFDGVSGRRVPIDIDLPTGQPRR